MEKETKLQHTEVNADLLAACEAVVLFYTADQWDINESSLWVSLTGHEAATTKVLADVCRAAIAKAKAEPEV